MEKNYVQFVTGNINVNDWYEEQFCSKRESNYNPTHAEGVIFIVSLNTLTNNTVLRADYNSPFMEEVIVESLLFLLHNVAICLQTDRNWFLHHSIESHFIVVHLIQNKSYKIRIRIPAHGYF